MDAQQRIHMTPTELGRHTGLYRGDVIARCMEWGVPIFQGRIDYQLFVETRREKEGQK